VHVVVPAGVDDQHRPSGGNVYDRRAVTELERLGWAVGRHEAPGAWPVPDDAARAALARHLDRLEDGSRVLLDGLVATSVPEVLVPEASRLRVSVLLHVPLADLHPGSVNAAREQAVLRAAARVVTTSDWSRRRVVHRYRLAGSRVHVAEPGVDEAAPVTGSEGGNRLLCVAAVTRTKGHDVLLRALRDVRDLDWTCVCVGSLLVEPDLVAALRRRLAADGLADRVSFAGVRTRGALAATYARADLLVAPSRVESYGMAATEALAHGIPVLASETGGLPDTLGRLPDGRVPGALVPPDDALGLGAAVRRWLTDPAWRRELRGAAAERRESLHPWRRTGDRLSAALLGAAS
jgi:glycosyltransferase involved in cell wall biosynthesis